MVSKTLRFHCSSSSAALDDDKPLCPTLQTQIAANYLLRCAVFPSLGVNFRTDCPGQASNLLDKFLRQEICCRETIVLRRRRTTWPKHPGAEKLLPKATPPWLSKATSISRMRP